MTQFGKNPASCVALKEGVETSLVHGLSRVEAGGSIAALPARKAWPGAKTSVGRKSAFSLPERLGYLHQYGSHCMAYSTLQPEMCHFDLAGVGYIAYKTVGRFFRRPVNVALADPISPDGAQAGLARAFAAACGPAIFTQISRSFAAELSSIGMKVNQMGLETDLDIQSFDLRGKARAQLRHWRNIVSKAGVTVHEVPSANLAKEVEELNRRWLARRGGRELALLARPFAHDDAREARCFVARTNGQTVAMSVFDPMHANNRIIGYYHNHDRYLPSCPHGTPAAITLSAMEQFRHEGLQVLSLGLSPLAGLGNEAFPHARQTAWFLRFLYDRCGFIYNCQGNFFHKTRYAGTDHPIYAASTNGTTIRDVLSVLRASKAV
jgi:phosphatidylglycerol lysyltransferase